MQTKFKDIAQYYLGTGLECENLFGNKVELLGINEDMWSFKDKGEHLFGYFYQCKPLLRSLDSLTKPITVKGYNDENSFVPIEEIGELDYDTFSLDYYKNHAIRLPFQLIQLLCSWHFNIFNLPETEYIKID